MSELLKSGMPIPYYKLDKYKKLFSQETKFHLPGLVFSGVLAHANRLMEPEVFFRTTRGRLNEIFVCI